MQMMSRKCDDDQHIADQSVRKIDESIQYNRGDYHDDELLIEDFAFDDYLEHCKCSCSDSECYINRRVCEQYNNFSWDSNDDSDSYREVLGYFDKPLENRINIFDEEIDNHRQYIDCDTEDNTDHRKVFTISRYDSEDTCTIKLPQNRLYKFKIDKTCSVLDLLDKVRNDFGFSKYDKFDVFHIIDDKHKKWLGSDESIENQIGSGQWNFELRLVAALYLWKPIVRVALNPLERVGHLSLKLYDNTYISHWPNKLRIKWKKQSKQHITLEDDIEAENGDPEEVLYFEGIKFFETRQDKIRNWWRINESSYNLFCNNCAQMVLNALCTGKMLPNKFLITPINVYKYVKRSLEKYQNLRDLYSKEYKEFCQQLTSQNQEYKDLEELKEIDQSIESIKIIRELKELYDKFGERQELLENSRYYEETEYFEKSNTLLEKIRVSEQEIRERKKQLLQFEESKQTDKIVAISSLIENLEKRNEVYDELHENIGVKQEFDKIFDANEIIFKPIKSRYKLLQQLKAGNKSDLKLIDLNINILNQQEILKN